MKALLTMALLIATFSSQARSPIRLDNILCSNDKGVSLNLQGLPGLGYQIDNIGTPVRRHDLYEVQSTRTESFENIDQTVLTGVLDADTCSTKRIDRGDGTFETQNICLAIYIPTYNFKLVMTGDTAVLYTRTQEKNFGDQKIQTTVLKCSTNGRVAPAL